MKTKKFLLLLGVLAVTNGSVVYTVDGIDDGIVILSNDDTLEVKEAELISLDGAYLVIKEGNHIEFLKVVDSE